MSNPTSPLSIIHHKEAELRHRLEAARQQAEVRLQAAREEARQIVTEAEQAGRVEAKNFFDQGIAAAQQEAQAILAVAHEKAAALHNPADNRLKAVAEQIVRLVLSGNSSST